MIHIPGLAYPVKEYLLEDVIEKLRLVRRLLFPSFSELGLQHPMITQLQLVIFLPASYKQSQW